MHRHEIYIKVCINSICSHVGWLYRRGKGTVLTPCPGSKISCLSIICCPNLQMMSRIFKHIIRMVGLCQGRHYFSPTRKDNLGMIIMGVYSIPCEWVEANIGQSGHSVKKTSYYPHKSAITEYSINWSHTATISERMGFLWASYVSVLLVPWWKGEGSLNKNVINCLEYDTMRSF